MKCFAIVLLLLVVPAIQCKSAGKEIIETRQQTTSQALSAQQLAAAVKVLHDQLTGAFDGLAKNAAGKEQIDTLIDDLFAPGGSLQILLESLNGQNGGPDLQSVILDVLSRVTGLLTNLLGPGKPLAALLTQGSGLSNIVESLLGTGGLVDNLVKGVGNLLGDKTLTLQKLLELIVSLLTGPNGLLTGLLKELSKPGGLLDGLLGPGTLLGNLLGSLVGKTGALTPLLKSLLGANGVVGNLFTTVGNLVNGLLGGKSGQGLGALLSNLLNGLGGLLSGNGGNGGVVPLLTNLLSQLLGIGGGGGGGSGGNGGGTGGLNISAIISAILKLLSNSTAGTGGNGGGNGGVDIGSLISAILKLLGNSTAGNGGTGGGNNPSALIALLLKLLGGGSGGNGTNGNNGNGGQNGGNTANLTYIQQLLEQLVAQGNRTNGNSGQNGTNGGSGNPSDAGISQLIALIQKLITQGGSGGGGGGGNNTGTSPTVPPIIPGGLLTIFKIGPNGLIGRVIDFLFKILGNVGGGIGSALNSIIQLLFGKIFSGLADVIVNILNKAGGIGTPIKNFLQSILNIIAGPASIPNKLVQAVNSFLAASRSDIGLLGNLAIVIQNVLNGKNGKAPTGIIKFVLQTILGLLTTNKDVVQALCFLQGTQPNTPLTTVVRVCLAAVNSQNLRNLLISQIQNQLPCKPVLQRSATPMMERQTAATVTLTVQEQTQQNIYNQCIRDQAIQAKSASG